METKKSKVIQVDQNIGQFITDNGTFYKHRIYFENEDKGIYNSKDSVCKKFTKDHEVDYTIESGGEYPDKIKPVQKEWTGGGKPQNNKSFALAYAKDLAVAHINQGEAFKAEHVIQVAKQFTKWLES